MCLNDKGDVIDFEEFVELFYEDCKKFNKFIGFFTNVKKEEDNKNYNSLKCMHILIIDFLNKFGHEYQKTKWKKYKKLLNDYKGIKIKKGYLHFLDRNKMLSEMKKPLRIIGMGFTFRMENRYY